MVAGNANGAGLGDSECVSFECLHSLSASVSPLSPGSCSHVPGDSVGGGGDSPAKPPHRDKENDREFCFGDLFGRNIGIV